MNAQCTSSPLQFHPLGRWEAVGRVDASRRLSDAGEVLLDEVDPRLGLMARLVACFRDCRQPGRTAHRVTQWIAQRVDGLALGDEDLHDHKALRVDRLLALLVGKTDLSSPQRPRAQHRGDPLVASSPQLKWGKPQEAERDRDCQIVTDPAALDSLLVEVWLESDAPSSKALGLDVDTTDDPLNGEQEGRFFHGDSRHDCDLSLSIFCGKHLVGARLRQPHLDASADRVQE